MGGNLHLTDIDSTSHNQEIYFSRVENVSSFTFIHLIFSNEILTYAWTNTVLSIADLIK